MQVGQQRHGRFEIETQVFVPLDIEEDDVSAGDARVCMVADCILTRHLDELSESAVTDDWNRGIRNGVSGTGRVSTVLFAALFQCGSRKTGEWKNSRLPPLVPFVCSDAVPSSMIMGNLLKLHD